MDSLSDQYLAKAIENYPFSLSEAVESLNYALSHDDENPVALKLMGQVYAEQLKDFPAAISNYHQALASDARYAEVFPHLISALIENGDYEEALKAGEYALKLKGTSKGWILLLIGFCYEYMEEYKKALKSFKLGKKSAYNSYFMDHLDSCMRRVKDKMPKKKKSKKSKKAKKGRKKKK